MSVKFHKDEFQLLYGAEKNKIIIERAAKSEGILPVN